MAIMTVSKRRTRFGALKIGDMFQWSDYFTYKKIDKERAVRCSKFFIPARYVVISVFAEKALVYRCKFTK